MKSNFEFCSILVVFMGFLATPALSKLPPGFDSCVKAPQFDKCLAKAIEKSLVELSKDKRPLGAHRVDPLEIVALNINQGTGPVSINLKFRDLVIRGIRNTKINNVVTDSKAGTLRVKVAVPRLQIDGKYTIDGKVLILPISGNDVCKLAFDNVVADVFIQFEKYKKDGKTYQRVTRFDFTFETTKLSIQLNNLFNGDKALSDNMNRFLNENSGDILKELKPAIQEALGVAFSATANRIFSKVPSDEIFPSS